MSEREMWIVLNKDLEKVCTDMVAHLPRVGPSGDRVVDILSGFLRKAERLLKAANLLAESDLWDEVQGLARVLLELRIKTDYFLKMLGDDAREACQTLMDSWLLQRMKEWETSQWLGVSPEVKSFFEKQMHEMRKRLTGDKIRQLRKYGFPGLNLEDCANAVGHGDVYQSIYRRFGRSIHSSDYVEFMAGPSIEEELRYREWRDPMIAYVVHFSAGGIAEYLNALVLGQCYDDPLDDIGQRCKHLRDQYSRGK